MKMSPELFAELSAAIARVGGLTPQAAMRTRWDQLWRSRFNVMRLYNSGLDDEHIDTALRRISKQAR